MRQHEKHYQPPHENLILVIHRSQLVQEEATEFQLGTFSYSDSLVNKVVYVHLLCAVIIFQWFFVPIFIVSTFSSYDILMLVLIHLGNFNVFALAIKNHRNFLAEWALVYGSIYWVSGSSNNEVMWWIYSFFFAIKAFPSSNVSLVIHLIEHLNHEVVFTQERYVIVSDVQIILCQLVHEGILICE